MLPLHVVPAGPYLALLTGLLFLTGCRFEEDTWEADIPSIGSSSSPVAVDLNDDGVLDIVIGGGGKEFTPTPNGVVALDGKDGHILWAHPGRNQFVGSAIVRDISGDGTPDVFIGGRSAQFLALDGRTGNPIWEYLPDSDTTDYLNDTTILNFFTPQWIPDQDADGNPDILTAYGGFVRAVAGDTARPVGYLMILSGSTGHTLARAPMPDGRETYVSPLVVDFGRGAEVVYGTGGENISGTLYRVPLARVMADDLRTSVAIADGRAKGFIAPPLALDLTLDGIPDIVVATVDGRLLAIDGSDDRTLWTAEPGGDYDTYTMPAWGYFTGDDDVPDLFASFGRGAWPTTEFTLHTLVDGSNGRIVWHDTLGTFQYASPLVASLTGEGTDDVLLAINDRATVDVLGDPITLLQNGLYVYPAGRGEPQLAFETERGSNLGSTPLLTDLDGDGNIDIVSAYMSDPRNFYSFVNLRIARREIRRDAGGIRAGRYLAPDGSGVFPSAGTAR